MAQWKVSGADERTGKDRTIVIEGDDEKGAAKAARADGVL